MSVQRIRLPSVNDIFPKTHETSQQLQLQTGVNINPAPQVFHSPITEPQQQNINYNGSNLNNSPNYHHHHQQQQQQHQEGIQAPVPTPQHVQHVQQLHHPHPIPQGIQTMTTSGHLLQQPHPYYSSNSGPMSINHHHHQQQQQQQFPPHQGPITPTHSPINYISPTHQFSSGANYVTAGQNYHYQQPRMLTPTSQHKYKITKNNSMSTVSTARQSNAWSSNDDELLKYLKEVKNLGWREISMYFQNRTANGCQFRWRRIVALSKQQHTFHGTIKRKDESVENSRSNSLESLLN